ncbi:hypothetical protein [Streptomyces cellulosae]|uniref:Uncharacterized protein n=1 Tax=Streptomyces cellulosae TaxID=1968 RepID=A0ABW7YI78_STRCE
MCGVVAAERAEEGATTPVPGFADLVTVDLFDEVQLGEEPPAQPPFTPGETIGHRYGCQGILNQPVLSLVAHLPGNQGTLVSADPLPVR